MTKRNHTRGFTLIEVVIAITLVSMLSLAILMSIRIAVNAQGRANAKLEDNRRMMGAQRALEQQLNGFMPVNAVFQTPNGGGPMAVPFFQGEPNVMRLVTSYSLNEASRGTPQILELAVIPGDQGRGVRLIVNEFPYRGGYSAGERIQALVPDSIAGRMLPQFPEVQTGPWSFVLADKLASCSFIYLQQRVFNQPPEWHGEWVSRRFPFAIRVEMAALDPAPGKLHPVSVTVPLHVNRNPEMSYRDSWQNY